MASIRMIVSIIAGMSVWFAAGQSHAVDPATVTFTVPVDVSNLPPEVRHVSVCCSIQGLDRSYGVPQCSSIAVVTGGAYRGELTARLSFLPYDPVGRPYECKVSPGGTVDGRPYTFDSYIRGGRDLPLSSGSFTVTGTVTR